jgi:hypothetical protein
VSGPFDTSQDAYDDAEALRGLLEAVNRSGARGDVWRGERAKVRTAYLLGVLDAAGVELRAYDRRIVDWVAGWDVETMQVIADWITRASRQATPQQ